MLTKTEKEYLLRLSRKTLEKSFDGREDLIPKNIPFDSLKKKMGTFVTLTKNGNLRGCIGHIFPINPIYIDIVRNSVSAAFEDTRFKPLRKEELDSIQIEISILSVPKKLDYNSPEDLLKRLNQNVDGVYLNFGRRSSTFLPQVWEKIPNKEDFLDQLCLKAWLPPGSWKNKNCEIYTYQVENFSEKLD